MQEITIRVGKDGKIDLGVLGVKGNSCKNLTKAMEKALGTAIEVEETAEHFEQEVQDDQKLGGW